MLWINRLFCHHQFLCLSQSALQRVAQTLSQTGHGAACTPALSQRGNLLPPWEGFDIGKPQPSFSLLERHPRAEPQRKRLHCPERSKSSKPFAFIGQIKNKQSLSFLSFHSANAHSPPRLSRHPAGVKAGSGDGGAEMQHRGELRAHPPCRAPCPLLPSLCQRSHGCAQDGGFRPLTFLLSGFLGFLFVLPCVSIIPAAPPSINCASPLIPDAPAQIPRVPTARPDKISSSCRSLQTVMKPF